MATHRRNDRTGGGLIYRALIRSFASAAKVPPLSFAVLPHSIHSQPLTSVRVLVFQFRNIDFLACLLNVPHWVTALPEGGPV